MAKNITLPQALAFVASKAGQLTNKQVSNNVKRIMFGKIQDLPSDFVSPFGELQVTKEQQEEAHKLVSFATPLEPSQLTGLMRMAGVKPAKVSALSKDAAFLTANVLFLESWLNKPAPSKAPGQDPVGFDWE